MITQEFVVDARSKLLLLLGGLLLGALLLGALLLRCLLRCLLLGSLLFLGHSQSSLKSIKATGLLPRRQRALSSSRLQRKRAARPGRQAKSRSSERVLAFDANQATDVALIKRVVETIGLQLAFLGRICTNP